MPSLSPITPMRALSPRSAPSSRSVSPLRTPRSSSASLLGRQERPTVRPYHDIAGRSSTSVFHSREGDRVSTTSALRPGGAEEKHITSFARSGEHIRSVQNPEQHEEEARAEKHFEHGRKLREIKKIKEGHSGDENVFEIHTGKRFNKQLLKKTLNKRLKAYGPTKHAYFSPSGKKFFLDLAEEHAKHKVHGMSFTGAQKMRMKKDIHHAHHEQKISTIEAYTMKKIVKGLK